jgi:hypothetical protein
MTTVSGFLGALIGFDFGRLIICSAEDQAQGLIHAGFLKLG